MKRASLIAIGLLAGMAFLPFLHSTAGGDFPLFCFGAGFFWHTRPWEEKMRAIPDPANHRAYMQRLTAHPHNVGSPYDKDNAEWIATKFKEFGLETQIENFDVLFPTPKERLIELVDGGPHFKARLQE